MRRRAFIAALGGAAAWPFVARAQQSERVRRVGVLMGIANDLEGQTRVAAFQTALQKLGWIEGHNVRIDYRWVAGDADLARADATEVVGLKPDVILANGTTPVVALRHETSTVPIVFLVGLDPVESGFVASLARPGGNITGFTTFEPEMGGKWLEVLKEIAPHAVRIALIFNSDTQPAYATFLRSVEAAAPRFAVEPGAIPIRSVSAIDSTIAAFGREPGGGFIVLPDVFTSTNRDAIIASTFEYRVPAIYPFPFFARRGGRMSYGIDLPDLFRRSASYVDRILRGTAPGELPVQTSNKFELIVNLKTARALKLEVPQSLLARADDVIE
jgi:putative tryptophan/tyrosine transport system substrate-binding protein